MNKNLTKLMSYLCETGKLLILTKTHSIFFNLDLRLSRGFGDVPSITSLPWCHRARAVFHGEGGGMASPFCHRGPTYLQFRLQCSLSV